MCLTNNKDKKIFVLLLMGVALVLMIIYGYTVRNSLLITGPKYLDWPTDQAPHHQRGISINEKNLRNFAKQDKFKLLKFDVSKNHIFVYLHMQKTGGTTIEKKLSTNLFEPHCDCKKVSKNARLICDCLRDNKEVWLVSRYTRLPNRGWPCGVHADWTELHACVPKLITKLYGRNPNRKFLYITQLRSPVSRFVSEFRNSQRGATWRKSEHKCKGKYADEKDLYCYKGDSWKGVSLQEFITCNKNLAINRQTRMLSDLELVNCYNRSSMSKARRDRTMLHSAMKNLMSMPFFGLVERPSESQFLFEKTFSLKFTEQWMLLDAGYASIYMVNISQAEVKKMEEINHLDIALHHFAEILFQQRLDYVMKMFNEKPLKTVVTENQKGGNVLRNNWKRISQKNSIQKGKKSS